MGSVIRAIIGGLVVGWAARFFYPGAVPMGLGMTILLGVGGSLLADFAVTRSGSDGHANRAGCLASAIGAMVLIFLARHLGLHGNW